MPDVDNLFKIKIDSLAIIMTHYRLPNDGRVLMSSKIIAKLHIFSEVYHNYTDLMRHSFGCPEAHALLRMHTSFLFRADFRDRNIMHIQT